MGRSEENLAGNLGVRTVFPCGKKGSVQPLSERHLYRISLSGVRTYESNVLHSARRFCGRVGAASICLCRLAFGDLVCHSAVFSSEGNEKPCQMADCAYCGNDSVLHLPDDPFFSGRCADDLLLWKLWLSDMGGLAENGFA